MERLAADLAETLKAGQAGQVSAKQGDLLPSGHPSFPPLTIGNECFCRNVDISMLFAEILSNLEKLPLLVNCKR